MNTSVENKIIISPILSSSDFKEFGQLYLRDIAGNYPFSTEFSATRYIEEHKNNIKNNFSTKKRTIWKGYIGNDIIGYTVATEKDSSSVKFGPTIIKRKYRGKNLATKLRVSVEEIYKNFGYVFFYSTTQEFNKPAQSYVINAGYTKDIVLKSHFIEGLDEVVYRKSILDSDQIKKSYSENETITFSDIYDISEAKLESILKKAKSKDKSVFKKSEQNILNRKTFLFSVDVNTIACIPKKGNSIKIIPLYLEFDSKNISKLIDHCFDYFSKHYNRSYLYVPSNSKFEEFFIKHGFVLSGKLTKFLKGQYVDLSVLSKSI